MHNKMCPRSFKKGLCIQKYMENVLFLERNKIEQINFHIWGRLLIKEAGYVHAEKLYRMGLSLKINEARITGFKLLSNESKKFLKDFSQVCEGEWCPLLVLPKNTRNDKLQWLWRMNLCLGQLSITGTYRIQIYFTSELSDNSRPDDAPNEE